MNSLDKIGIRVEFSSPAGYQGDTLPILHEILEALARLQSHGESTVIDLMAMPMGPGMEDRLFSFLGEGEITTVLEAQGESVLRESAYAGVWLVEHKSSGGERLALQIEVTDVPAIVRTQQEDIRDSYSSLKNMLKGFSTDQ